MATSQPADLKRARSAATLLALLPVALAPLPACGGGHQAAPAPAAEPAAAEERAEAEPIAAQVARRAGSEPGAAAPKPGPGAEADPVEALRRAAAATAARAEHADETVKVAHILVSFEGAGTAVKGRTVEQAEVRAAELYARVVAGEDFETLRAASTDDPGPATYLMSLSAGKARAIARQAMVPAFGDVGWRLQVGEVGVAAYDPDASPYGWHIIKRLR